MLGLWGANWIWKPPEKDGAAVFSPPPVTPFLREGEGGWGKKGKGEEQHGCRSMDYLNFKEFVLDHKNEKGEKNLL